jgi:hypothetical protein
MADIELRRAFSAQYGPRLKQTTLDSLNRSAHWPSTHKTHQRPSLNHGEALMGLTDRDLRAKRDNKLTNLTAWIASFVRVPCR